MLKALSLKARFILLGTMAIVPLLILSGLAIYNAHAIKQLTQLSDTYNNFAMGLNDIHMDVKNIELSARETLIDKEDPAQLDGNIAKMNETYERLTKMVENMNQHELTTAEDEKELAEVHAFVTEAVRLSREDLAQAIREKDTNPELYARVDTMVDENCTKAGEAIHRLATKFEKIAMSYDDDTSAEANRSLEWSLILAAILILTVTPMVYAIGVNIISNMGAMSKSFVTNSGKVSTASGEVNEAISSLVAGNEETSAQTKIVLKNAADASTYVGSVSHAVTELNASIQDISKSVTETNACVSDAVEQTQQTGRVIASLGEAAKNIGDVVQMITELAEQTNLLALNAAIEAARAGDAGRGFAVVADEVKKLASNTTQATDNIRGQIANIQKVASECVQSLEKVTGAVSKIQDNTTTVSAAIEEQSGVAKQIAASVTDAAERVGKVESNMDGIEQAAVASAASSHQLQESTRVMSDAFGELRRGFDGVLKELGMRA